MKKWLTLLGFCSVNTINGLGFGILSDNHDAYATYYNMSESSFQNIFYVGLFVEILFCLPAIRVIEWRLDYSINTAAYLSVCAYSLNFFAIENVVIAYASQILGAVAQLFLLPTCLYVAETWFPLEERSLAIGIGFYSNIVGFGLGGIMISLVGKQPQGVRLVMEIVTGLALIAFLIALAIVRNEPKVRIEKKKRVEWIHFKDLWRQKYIAYNAVASSAFLGVAWTFQSQYQILEKLFGTHDKVPILMFIWIVSGGGFGVLMAWLVQVWVRRTGEFKYYDWACKCTLIIGYLGFIAAGILVEVQYASFPLFIVIVICIGLGSLGFYGLNFMSLIQSLYPVPSILVGTIVAAFASVYSSIALSVSMMFPVINPYFSIVIVMSTPLLYIIVCFETNFKRYRYYLNEKETKFQLLKIEEDTEFGD